jgi:hypothetical protein
MEPMKRMRAINQAIAQQRDDMIYCINCGLLRWKSEQSAYDKDWCRYCYGDDDYGEYVDD